VANFFKTLRLLHKEDPVYTQKYAQTVSVLQEIGECQGDAIRRAYEHVDNNHKGLLPVQLEEIKQIKDLVVSLLNRTSNALMQKEIADCSALVSDKEKLKQLGETFDKNQVARIQDESSKTRLSILFYGFIRDLNIIADQTYNLMKIFQDSFNMNNEKISCP
jgi:Na+/phosphate symporter